MSKPWQPYIDSILNGTRLAGRLERLAVDLALRRMNDPRYTFDEDDALWAIEVISTFKHTKGDYKGRPFELLDWQKFFIALIFGLKFKSSGLRVTRKVLLVIAKKGGKSELGGAIGLLMAFYDGENTAECYTAANKRDQAAFSFDSAKVMTKFLKAEGELEDVTVYDSHVNMELKSSEGSSFKATASDASKQDGVFPHFGMIDEYHEARDSAMPDNLESGMVSRAQPLLLIITTRGFNYMGALWQMEQKYESILDGSVEDDSVFPLIFCMDEGDNWEEEKNWEKSNPGIGQTPNWEGLRQQYVSAKNEGGQKLVSFKTKNLNIWEKAASAWIAREDYLKGSSDFDTSILAGRTCYGGLDLATVRDLTAWTLLFPPTDDDPKFYVLSRFWCPEDNARVRATRDKVLYLDWSDQGHLTLTPGNTTDYSYIEQAVLESCQSYDVKLAYYDRFNASPLVASLILADAPMEPFNQSTINFSSPIETLEKTILDGLLDHQNHPVLAWCISNVVLKSDAGGNIRFDKGSSREKIDGAVALGMSFAGYLTNKKDEKIEDIIFF